MNNIRFELPSQTKTFLVKHKKVNGNYEFVWSRYDWYRSTVESKLHRSFISTQKCYNKSLIETTPSRCFKLLCGRTSVCGNVEQACPNIWLAWNVQNSKNDLSYGNNKSSKNNQVIRVTFRLIWMKPKTVLLERSWDIEILTNISLTHKSSLFHTADLPRVTLYCI